MAEAKKNMSSNQIKLYADIVLLIGFVIVNAPGATGIPIHEWASLLFIGPILVHILLDWKWVASVTQRMFKPLPSEVRFNHLWDLLIFVMMVFVLFNGFIVSEALLPTLGIPIIVDPFWVEMHHISANLLIVLVGVHVAMHWRWIVNSVKRYILRSSAKSAV